MIKLIFVDPFSFGRLFIKIISFEADSKCEQKS
jgi:hypothetical protein